MTAGLQYKDDSGKTQYNSLCDCRIGTNPVEYFPTYPNKLNLGPLYTHPVKVTKLIVSKFPPTSEYYKVQNTGVLFQAKFYNMVNAEVFNLFTTSSSAYSFSGFQYSYNAPNGYYAVAKVTIISSYTTLILVSTGGTRYTYSTGSSQQLTFTLNGGVNVAIGGFAVCGNVLP